MACPVFLFPCASRSHFHSQCLIHWGNCLRGERGAEQRGGAGRERKEADRQAGELEDEQSCQQSSSPIQAQPGLLLAPCARGSEREGAWRSGRMRLLELLAGHSTSSAFSTSATGLLCFISKINTSKAGDMNRFTWRSINLGTLPPCYCFVDAWN